MTVLWLKVAQARFGRLSWSFPPPGPSLLAGEIRKLRQVYFFPPFSSAIGCAPWCQVDWLDSFLEPLFIFVVFVSFCLFVSFWFCVCCFFYYYYCQFYNKQWKNGSQKEFNVGSWVRWSYIISVKCQHFLHRWPTALLILHSKYHCCWHFTCSTCSVTPELPNPDVHLPCVILRQGRCLGLLPPSLSSLDLSFSEGGNPLLYHIFLPVPKMPGLVYQIGVERG